MKKILYVKTANLPWEILPHRVRATLFRECAVSSVFFMPKGYSLSDETCKNESIQDLKGKIQKLYDIIQATQPDLIYLCTSPHSKSEFLFPALKQKFPQITFWVEQYDNSDLFSTDFLMQNGYVAEEASNAQADARFAAENADFIIHKNGGRLWNDYCRARSMRAEIRWHPLVSEVETKAKPPPSSALVSASGDENMVNICLCGSVPAKIYENTLEQIAKEQTLLRVLYSLSEINQVRLYIFNPADRNNAASYKALRDWCKNRKNPISYSQYLPQAALTMALKKMHLGLFLLPTSAQGVEELVKVGNPNRLSTLIAHEIPVLVDVAIVDIAEAIKRANAGLVLSDRDIPQLPSLIAGMDLARLKQGAMTLKREWQGENKAGFLKLQAALSASS